MAGSAPSPIWDTMAAKTEARVTTARSRAEFFGAMAGSAPAPAEEEASAFSSTVSRAKKTPLMGALKPAEMPAADPAARRAGKHLLGTACLKLEAKDLPISTEGPSGPRLKPEPSVIAARAESTRGRTLSTSFDPRPSPSVACWRAS